MTVRMDCFKLIKMSAFVMLIALCGCATGQSAEPPPPWSWPPITDFMKADGTELEGGFRFMGSNLDPWRFNTAIGEIYSQSEIENWVSNAVRFTHARVIRMHMNGGAFEPEVGTYGEPAFKQLDRLLAAAAEYNVYVLIDLRDYCWGPWPKDGRCYDPYWYLDGGTVSNPKKDNILTNADAIGYFKDFISHVVNRVNTVTGVTYKDDIHIFGWEIINEPNMVPGIKNWFVEIGGYVKSLDGKHLVGMATGDLSSAGWEPGAANWDALAVPELDFIDIHYYADFYNTGNTDWAPRYVRIVSSAAALGKPVLIGEFGYFNNFPRARLSNLYRTIITDSFDGGLCGVMPYSWGPPGPNRYGDVGSFCLYTGDADLCGLLRDSAP